MWHNATMDMKDWIASLPGSPLPTQAAEASGIDRSTISRQLKRGQLSAENVIAICHAFRKSAVDGLIETGYLTPDDLEGAGIVEALAQATNQQIVDEISKRLAVGTGDLFTQDAEVVEFPNPDTWKPGEYVADSSPEEPEPGIEGYNNSF